MKTIKKFIEDLKILYPKGKEFKKDIVCFKDSENTNLYKSLNWKTDYQFSYYNEVEFRNYFENE